MDIVKLDSSPDSFGDLPIVSNDSEVTDTLYWYEIGINQGTEYSFSRDYPGDSSFTLENWATQRLNSYNFPTDGKVVPLILDQLYIILLEDEIVEVVWLIDKSEATFEEIEMLEAINAYKEKYESDDDDIEPWDGD